MLSRTRPEDKVRSLASKRLRRVNNDEVLNWAEQAINSVHQTLDLHRRHGDRDSLEAAAEAVSSIQGAIDVLKARLQVG